MVHALTGCAVQEFTSLDDPLAPDTAARLRGVPIPPVAEYVDRIKVLAESHDTVIVEGAGGLLVRLDTDGGTLLDLAEALAADVVVVVAAGLGTLNHTELTVNALRGARAGARGAGGRLVARRSGTGRAVQPRRPASGHRHAAARGPSGGRRRPVPGGVPAAGAGLVPLTRVSPQAG